MNLPIRKPRVFKATAFAGIKSIPHWYMTDGWTTYMCTDWEDAMRKARRRARGLPA